MMIYVSSVGFSVQNEWDFKSRNNTIHMMIVKTQPPRSVVLSLDFVDSVIASTGTTNKAFQS